MKIVKKFIWAILIGVGLIVTLIGSVTGGADSKIAMIGSIVMFAGIAVGVVKLVKYIKHPTPKGEKKQGKVMVTVKDKHGNVLGKIPQRTPAPVRIKSLTNSTMEIKYDIGTDKYIAMDGTGFNAEKRVFEDREAGVDRRKDHNIFEVN